jgi:excisionase family DNA binding protein
VLYSYNTIAGTLYLQLFRCGGIYMDALLSVEEAARRLGGISKWTVHAWLAKGKLRRTKVGSRTMIHERDLQAFIASCNPESAVSVPAARAM